jgi:predicted CxxxxCH...CXXCH cytochrome family protein
VNRLLLQALLLLVVLVGCDDTLFGLSEAVDWGDEPWCQTQRVFHEECSSCHGKVSPRLEGVKAYENLIDVESTEYPGQVYVVPGEPGASFLYQKVTGEQGEHGEPMPLGSNGLDPESVGVIVDWIKAGAPIECESTVEKGPAKPYHPEGWVDRTVHGPAAKFQEESCTECHGADLAGGLVGVSCDSCHQSGWREDCIFCHGGEENNTGAPPRDISNETVSELLSFPPHTRHVTTGWSEGFDCVQCHTKPTDLLSLGHIFVGDSTPGEAEVNFGEGLSAAASFNGNGSCSNLYCHGNGQGDNGSVLSTATDLSCSSCHPDASSERDDWKTMSGEHEEHMRRGAVCAQCHGATVDATQNVIDPSLHVNGSVQLQPEPPVVWDANTKTCAGTCHIGEREEIHESASWQ